MLTWSATRFIGLQWLLDDCPGGSRGRNTRLGYCFGIALGGAHLGGLLVSPAEADLRLPPISRTLLGGVAMGAAFFLIREVFVLIAARQAEPQRGRAEP